MVRVVPVRGYVTHPTRCPRHIGTSYSAKLLASCAVPLHLQWCGPTGTPTIRRSKPATVEAFNHYVHLTDSRHEADLQQGAESLWIDSLDGQARNERLCGA